jgi:hypothetical protein
MCRGIGDIRDAFGQLELDGYCFRRPRECAAADFMLRLDRDAMVCALGSARFWPSLRSQRVASFAAKNPRKRCGQVTGHGFGI